MYVFNKHERVGNMKYLKENGRRNNDWFIFCCPPNPSCKDCPLSADGVFCTLLHDIEFFMENKKWHP